MNRSLRGWVTFLALIGVAAATSSTYIHLQLVVNPTYSSFCDVNQTVSCSQLYQSRYGTVLGIPVALAGVFWFGVVLLLVFADVRGPVSSRQNIASYFLVWTTVGLSVAMYMAYASIFVLGAFCILCGVVYIAVGGIFLMTGAEAATPLRRLPSALAGDLGVLVRRPVGLTLALLFTAASMVSVVSFSEANWSIPTENLTTASERQLSPADEESDFERFWSNQPRLDSLMTDVEAPVVVVKFNDYQCPACAQTHMVYDPIFTKYETSHPGSVRLVTRDFPLDSSCNGASPNGQHEAACDAAIAVRYARGVGAIEARRMEEWLYGNQAEMDRNTIATALAEITGIGAADIDFRRSDLIDALQLDIAAGASLPVEATPTFIINGVVIKGGLAPQFFDRAIGFELDEATIHR
tara:strand:- start:21218 stop:22444 length:1227 start_codon:yes stop_codon:yes gene_type:complete